MSRTTGRVLELLGLLQAQREWSGAELCRRLEVSPRTLRRDIDDLRGLGYGIGSASGVGGGYRLGPGASVPPLVLAPEEAVAIAVGLRAAASATVTGIEDAAARALAKLEGSLSSETRQHIASVGRALTPLGTGGETVAMTTVTTLARAIDLSRRLRVDYLRHDGQEVRRVIEPHRIVHTGARWYVIARDPDRDAWRTLRIDRLTPRPPIGGVFVARSIPDDVLREFTTRSIASAPYPHRYRVRMHAPAAEVAAQFGPTIAEVTPIDEFSCELSAGAESPEQFAVYVGTSGIDFEVLDGHSDDGRSDSDGLRVTLRRLSARFERAASR